jgi:DNA-binding MarR family transcriptional regulator
MMFHLHQLRKMRLVDRMMRAHLTAQSRMGPPNSNVVNENIGNARRNALDEACPTAHEVSMRRPSTPTAVKRDAPQQTRLRGAGGSRRTGGPALGDAGDRITALLHRIVARASANANEEFRPYGFNVQGARVLIALLDAGPTRVGELSYALAIDLSTLSHLLRRFSREHLVIRSRVDVDNRSVSVALTAKGRRIARKCKTARARHEAMLLKGFIAPDIRSVRDMLRRICANVEGTPPDARTPRRAR